MRILVTGSEGVLGFSLCRYLRTIGHDPITLDIVGKAFYKVDVRDFQAMSIVGEVRPDVIIHMAASAPHASAIYRDVSEDVSTNILGTRNVLEQAAKIQSLVIFTSSCAVYGNAGFHLQRPLVETDAGVTVPTSPYGIDKMAAEEYVKMYSRDFSFPYVNLRLGNVYSDFDNKYLLWQLFNSKDSFEVFGHGKMARDFVYVGDFNFLIERILIAHRHMKIISGTYNVGHESIDVKSVISSFRRIAGYPKELVSTSGRRGEFDKMEMNWNKVRMMFGWQPKTLMIPDGIKKCFDSFKERTGQ